MALLNTRMAAAIIAELDTIPEVQGNSPEFALSQRVLVWNAICKGIVDEIQANARATGLDSGNDTHDLDID